MRGLGAMDSLGIGDRLRYLGPCVFAGELFDLGRYPGWRLGEAEVVGELYVLLDSQVLEVLDEFEGYDPAQPHESLYLRKRVRLIQPSETDAWIYLYNHAPDPDARILGGDWRAHLNSRRAT